MVDLKDMLERMGERDIQSILLEGGQSLAGSMLKSNLIDKFIFFYGTKLIGGEGKDLFAGAGLKKMRDAFSVNIRRVIRSGNDIMVEAYLGEKDVYRVD
jgi:diaminohydroxyphosphoribosylaminopyrimidine deaminase/5-amino-6-(5-phosphoribosylamino)uracil reductase